MADVAARSSSSCESGCPVEYDAGGIGKRYRRQDEIGTPFCFTVDYETLEDHTVTLRDRDTLEQVRVPIGELADELAARQWPGVRRLGLEAAAALLGPTHPTCSVAKWSAGRAVRRGAAACPRAGAGTAARLEVGPRQHAASRSGSHQFQRPMSSIVAGTSTSRTSVASSAIATASPSPISLIEGAPVPANTANTATMISAALEIVAALRAQALGHGAAVSPVAS